MKNDLGEPMLAMIVAPILKNNDPLTPSELKPDPLAPIPFLGHDPVAPNKQMYDPVAPIFRPMILRHPLHDPGAPFPRFGPPT